jgi:DNA-binding transcriptional regulator YiaG
MPNIAAVLKEEISRLSRKEARRETEAIRKASAQYRRHIAALKRQVAKLDRQVAVLSKASLERSRSPAADDPVTRVRFVAKGLRSHRERLGQSAEQFAKLVGVSAQSIYNWERGVTRPREPQLRVLATIRGLGKREAQARLEQLASQAPKRRRKS